MTQKRKFHFLRNFLAVVLAITAVCALAVWIINRPETLAHALAVANVKSPWKTEVQKFHWDALKSKITIEGIVSANTAAGKELSAGAIRISYKLLGFVRGKLVIDNISIEDASLNLPAAPDRPKKKEKAILNLAKLVLLNNLELQNGRVTNFKASFGKGLGAGSGETSFSLIPSIWGQTRFLAAARDLSFTKAGLDILSAGSLNLNVSTELMRWHPEFPFMNAFDGELNLTGINFEDLSAEKLSAQISFDDDRMELKNFDLSIKGRSLSGNIALNTSDEKFDLNIEAPKPISLPYIGRDLETVDTAGELSAKVRLTGAGLLPLKAKGSGRVELMHRFNVSPDAPVSIKTDASFANGVIKFKDAEGSAGADAFSAGGQIDIPGKNFKFEAHGSRFPLERVFDKFKEPQIRKIFGPTDFSGSFEGWGKKFLAKVEGTTFGGGWRPISAERVESVLESTYDLLTLKGKIFSGERQTGNAGLAIKYGPKKAGAIRPKDIDFTAELSGHSLDESLSALSVKGAGSGSVWIRGPQSAFKGEAKGEIQNGSWHGIPFERVASKLSISRRELKFTDIDLVLPREVHPDMSGTIAGDINEGSLRLRGEPMPGLILDVTQRYSDGSWQIANISWNDPAHPGGGLAAHGDISAGGASNLKIKGRADLGTAALFVPFIKEGSGPVDVDVVVRGPNSVSGKLQFNNNTLLTRGMRLSLEDLKGMLLFEGPKIRFDGVGAKSDEGDLNLSGSVEHGDFSLESADVALKASAVRYRSEDGNLSLELDGDLKIIGAFPDPILKGSVTILDGKYTKDFIILDALSAKRPPKRTAKDILFHFDPRLDLKIRNGGDLAIRNNVGDIWLNMNTTLKGTLLKPVLAGSVDVVDGKVHYLGAMFDINKGFVEFRERYAEPYLEVYAQKEISLYNVGLVLHGPTDNLALDLSATSPTGSLEKRDVVSLLLFGATEAERTAAAERAGGLVTAGVAGQVISGVIGAPIQKVTHLDVFRLEAGDTSSSNISRLYFGKQISDRLSVNFATDINSQDAVQTVIGEYLITDNLLISGQRSTDSNFRFGGLLRFRIR